MIKFYKKTEPMEPETIKKNGGDLKNLGGRKKVLITMLLTIIVLPMWGGPIDENTARKVANQTLSRSSAKNSTADAIQQNEQSPQKTLQLLYRNNTTAHDGQTITDEPVYYYVFGAEDNAGFVIVAGDDRVTPVLGYSYTNDFPTDNMPDNLKWWLSEYVRQIEYAIENNIEPTVEIKQLWAQYFDTNYNEKED